MNRLRATLIFGTMLLAALLPGGAQAVPEPMSGVAASVDAQTSSSHRAETRATAKRAAAMTQIEDVLKQQVGAWNRGDITAFMRGYDASDETTFVGSEVEHGYDAILKRYQRRFATRAQMGTLRFSDLDTRLLSDTVAVTTGHFELTFAPTLSATAPPPKSGIFSLVWVKREVGWRIVLDHTS